MEECNYYNECGGCSLQKLTYDEEIQKKEFKINALFKGITLETFKGNPFNYRNRIDFAAFENGIGFKKKGKWNEFVDIKKCLIASEKINNLLLEIQKITLPKNIFKYIVIRTSSSGESVTFVTEKSFEEAKKSFNFNISAQNIIIAKVPKNKDQSTSEEIEIIKGNSFLSEKINKKEFFYHTQSFFQNNLKVAEMMVKETQKIIFPLKPKRILDLYGGVGLFGLSIEGNFDLDIVELSKLSIEMAKKNIKNLGSKAKAYAKDAKEIKIEHDIVITDPPRSGMDRSIISKIVQAKPKKIIYISCNPQKLATEQYLFRGYKLKSLKMFDMFPRTEHIEVMGEFDLNV